MYPEIISPRILLQTDNKIMRRCQIQRRMFYKKQKFPLYKEWEF